MNGIKYKYIILQKNGYLINLGYKVLKKRRHLNMNGTEKYLKNFNEMLWYSLKYYLGKYETDFKFPLYDDNRKKELKVLQLKKQSI